MTLKNVRHLKKCIRENIFEINSNKLKDSADIESLMRFASWVYHDSTELLKEWKPSASQDKEQEVNKK